jgi:hypothetical protein
VGLGVRGELLVVYVRNELVARQIPQMVCDAKVDITISGDITAAV